MMTPEQQKAYNLGYLAGFNDEYECPYPEDSIESDWWYIGYSDGVDGYSRSFDL